MASQKAGKLAGSARSQTLLHLYDPPKQRENGKFSSKEKKTVSPLKSFSVWQFISLSSYVAQIP